MIQSETIGKLATALAKAQALIKPASKDAINPHFGKKYADLTAIWDACREPLTSQGLSVTQIPLSGDPGYLTLMTMLMHESGEYIGGVYAVRVAQDTAQAMGSALTYAKRQALSALVGIVADDDDDGNAASPPPRVESRASPAAPRTAPAPRSATKPAQVDTDKAALVAEVAALATRAAKARVNVQPKKSLSQMDMRELTNHKAALLAALDLNEGGSPE